MEIGDLTLDCMWISASEMVNLHGHAHIFQKQYKASARDRQSAAVSTILKNPLSPHCFQSPRGDRRVNISRIPDMVYLVWYLSILFFFAFVFLLILKN